MEVMSDKLVVLFADGPDAAANLEKEASRRGLRIIDKEEQVGRSPVDYSQVTRLKYTCADPSDIME